ncbi:MAG: hypothetical protein AAGK78_09435, partial [Planctomycetota bacterium]
MAGGSTPPDVMPDIAPLETPVAPDTENRPADDAEHGASSKSRDILRLVVTVASCVLLVGLAAVATYIIYTNEPEA